MWRAGCSAPGCFSPIRFLVAIVGSCMFLQLRQAAMPITLPKYDPHDRYMVLCVPLKYQRPGLHNRHVAIFLEGYFDLGEATKFVHAVLEMDLDPPQKNTSSSGIGTRTLSRSRGLLTPPTKQPLRVCST